MKKTIFTLLLLTLLVPSLSHAHDKESVYERVMKSGKIRCGYVISHPALFKDANTGTLSGISYDAMNKMADILNLDIEWVEEVGWGTLFSGFKTGRYDALCSAIWSMPERAKQGEFLDPLWYGAVHAWAREGDSRFENGLKDIDWSTLKIATLDGHISSNVARGHFPQSKTVSAPDLSLISETFLMVSTGKADITFEQQYVGRDFLEKNPGTIKNITQGSPIKAYPTAVIIPAGEYRLKTVLNSAQAELINSGETNKIIDKYEAHLGSFLRVSRPYEVSK